MDISFSLNDIPQGWWDAWDQIWHLLLAFALAVPIGWDREQRDLSAGLRTFPMVAIVACAILLVGQAVAQGNAEAEARALYGVVTGIGFLGAGAILKEGTHVIGVTTAASLWATAAMGLAVAADQFVIAIFLAATTFVLLLAKRETTDETNHDSREPAKKP